MSKPNCDRFIAIVGAPRSGTTSLADFLRRHEDVDFSFVKEPHFFSQFDLSEHSDEELSDLVTREYVRRYFPTRRPDAVLAEGSVSYLYRPRQMLPLLRIWPEAKFIIAVRDPMQMLPSLHQRLLYLGDEVVTDFNKAWILADSRRRGENIPRTCVDPTWLQYDEAGRLGKYVEEFVSVVGRERCLIVLFDDLAADPASEYRKLLEFVGLPYDGRQDFAPRRESRGYKSGTLQRLLKRPPKAVRSVLAGEQYRQRVMNLDRTRSFGSNLSQAVMAGRKLLLRWNKAAAPKVNIDPGLRRIIRDKLREDVNRLSKLIGRDLNHWLSQQSSGN